MTTNKTAIVTGASSGIGLGIATALLDSGYNVVANSRRISKADSLTPSHRLALVDGDIALPETADRIIRAAVEHFGGVDLLVNNAGIFVPKPFDEYTVEDFERVTATNVAGFFHITQRAVKEMRKQKSGQIVNITTSLVEQPMADVPSALTAITKGGLNAVTEALAIELAPAGIRVNAVAPGIVDTPMHKPETHEFLKQLHPIHRMGSVEEIVEAVLYLANASFVTGEVLHVDGGAHAGKW